MAELKIFKPEVKKPDGATEKIALSGTILSFEHRRDFPVDGVSDVLYFSQYEGLLYQWDTNSAYYKPLNAESIYYYNLIGDNAEGKISIKLMSDEFGMPILSPVFSKYNEGAGTWSDKKILLEGDVSVDLSNLVKYNKGAFEQQSYIELLYDDESKPSYLMSPAAGIVTESSESLAVLGSYALPFYRINGRGINALEALNTPKLCIYNKGVIEYSKAGASSTSKYTYNLPEKNGTIALTKDLDNYLLKTAKAADSDKLDGHDGSYYLNYNNLTNVPTIDLQGFAKYGKDESIDGIKLLYDDGSAPKYLITSNFGLIPGSAGSSSIGTRWYQFGAIHGMDYNVHNSLKITEGKKIYHGSYELSLPTKEGVIALVSDIANNISLVDEGTEPIIGDIEYNDGTFTVSRIGLEDLGLASAYKYKGSKTTLSDIENLTNMNIGDVWNCEESGMNYAWDGEQWDALGSIVDLSDYATKQWVEDKGYVTSGWIDDKNYATQEWVGDNFLSLSGGTINGNLVVTDTTDTKTLTVNKIEPGISEDGKPNVSVRVGANLVIKNGSVVLGDGGQVHARGQFTTHANRILFASQYDDDLSREEHFSYSLSLPFAANQHTKNVAAFLPENGGHLATKEYLKNEFCYWSIKKFWYDSSGKWCVHLAVEGKNIDHINLLLCSQSEGWSCPNDANFIVEYDDLVTNIYFNADDFDILTLNNMIGAYNFKETSHLGHIRDTQDLLEHTILRHPIYFKFVAVTKNNYKFDSTVMKVTQRSDKRYILDIQ